MMPGETRFQPASVRMMEAPHSVETYCGNCGKVVVTFVEYEPGTCTYLLTPVMPIGDCRTCTYLSCVGLVLIG